MAYGESALIISVCSFRYKLPEDKKGVCNVFLRRDYLAYHFIAHVMLVRTLYRRYTIIIIIFIIIIIIIIVIIIIIITIIKYCCDY